LQIAVFASFAPAESSQGGSLKLRLALLPESERELIMQALERTGGTASGPPVNCKSVTNPALQD